jgi:hypothetical protein
LSSTFERVEESLFADDCCHMNADRYQRVADEVARHVVTYIESSSPQ